MDANSLLQLILLTIALGALVYCLIQARGARDICNKLMKDIERYIKKSEQMELPLKMKKTKKIINEYCTFLCSFNLSSLCHYLCHKFLSQCHLRSSI